MQTQGDTHMTTTNENQTTKSKQVPDFYIFENGANGERSGKPAGAAFFHKKGKGFTLLIDGKRYAAFPPKAKPAQPEATDGASA
jgi:hypothetical protein